MKISHNLTASLILITTLLFPLVAWSQQTSQQIANQQDWISRQQQNQIEKNRRLRQQKAAEREKARKALIEKKQATIIHHEECYPIKTIRLTGAEEVSKNQQKKLVSPFIGKCVTRQVLAEIITTIQNYYDNEGYLAAQVNMPKQDFKSGDLEVKIIEGKIAELILGKNSTIEKMQKLTAFGNIEGTAVKYSDISQGLNQMNRLSSNDASLANIDLSDDGTTKVYIENKQKFPISGSVGYDSLGNDYTGVHRTNFATEIDNIFFLNDSANLTYTANLNSDNKIKNNKSFTGNFSIPFGYNTFSYDYSHNEFMKLEDIGHITGYSEISTITADRVFLNKEDLTISGDTSLTTKSSASYINQHKIDISERKLTIANVEFAVSKTFKNDVNLYVKPTYSQGLKILNAEKDNQNFDNRVPKAQFKRLKLYASLSKDLKVARLSKPITLGTEINAQYSKDSLFGSEQFTIGGYDSVRGFRDSFLTGNSGYSFRNSAKFNVGSLISALINNKDLSHLNKFSIEPFYDYGHVSTKFNHTSGRLASTGLKTLFESQYFNASLTYAVVTNRSQLLESTKKENKMLYFELTALCC